MHSEVDGRGGGGEVIHRLSNLHRCESCHKVRAQPTKVSQSEKSFLSRIFDLLADLEYGNENDLFRATGCLAACTRSEYR